MFVSIAIGLQETYGPRCDLGSKLQFGRGDNLRGLPLCYFGMRLLQMHMGCIQWEHDGAVILFG